MYYIYIMINDSDLAWHISRMCEIKKNMCQQNKYVCTMSYTYDMCLYVRDILLWGMIDLLLLTQVRKYIT